jgi:hypothetical protein
MVKFIFCLHPFVKLGSMNINFGQDREGKISTSLLGIAMPSPSTWIGLGRGANNYICSITTTVVLGILCDSVDTSNALV